MTLVSDFQNGFNELIENGQIIRIKYYNTSWGAGSYYDDDVILTQSGSNLWISGIVFPISNKFGSSDAILLEQGKILMSDSKIYIQGNINTSGTIKIGLGSYTNMSGCEYSLLVEGVNKWNVSNTPIYKKLYIRQLTNGSLYGE
jgi:hypothetical protein